MKKTLVVIAGPTAVGKTAASIAIAKELNCEIVSADSRQFYKELNIGTAKPAAEELNSVKHHFINNLSLDEEYNAGRFETEAVELIEKKLRSSDYIIMTGGSGLYIDAVTKGFDQLPEADTGLRKKLENEMNEKGISFLQESLKFYDEKYYNEVDLQNPHRLIRALEVCMLTGKPYSSFRNKNIINRNFNIVNIALDMPRDELYERINKRVDAMIDAGLVDEVRSLKRFYGKNALQTVGYSEIISFLNEEITFDKAVELIKRNTRRYAKRQLTWFRRGDYRWFHPGEIKEMLDYIRSN